MKYIFGQGHEDMIVWTRGPGIPDPNCPECEGQGMADEAWSDDDWWFCPCSKCGGYPDWLREK
jgi:hypothetical protein